MPGHAKAYVLGALLHAQGLLVCANCLLCGAGDEGIRKANEARFTDRLAAGYASKRKERLASAEVLCRKQISEFTNRLHQVGRLVPWLSQDTCTWTCASLVGIHRKALPVPPEMTAVSTSAACSYSLQAYVLCS